ncbi:hypothetical protein SSUA7_0458 [Streptococcus suis A7]|uniref:Uncharacterized protein n=1 Tax=Streptococcus suis (strain GZ1) TaxID=423211 RepID=D5AGF0_STRGZ|nr:hypothetical protein SSGZ1_0450 [Streptococcus suis GZ1]ADV69568.1 hypothetical protein SSUJS14_0467 [Streptococcus suis JS14]AER14654.1 hypothetical protein SSU12_0463 [Streptococcus suis SS12]AER43786.1 hypothetical protein SSUA7_0458 [Streptococcus suis A7]
MAGKLEFAFKFFGNFNAVADRSLATFFWRIEDIDISSFGLSSISPFG